MNLNKNHGSIGDKIIIKETGEDEVIQNAYGVVTLHLSFDLDFDLDIKETMKFKHSDTKPDGWYYTTTDGKEYHEDKLIVGKDNIRDHKINQINGIQQKVSK